jgi:hypothetical protein
MDRGGHIDHLVALRERLIRLQANVSHFKAKTVLREVNVRMRRDYNRVGYKDRVDNRYCHMTEPEKKRFDQSMRRAYRILGRQYHR